MPQSRGRRKQTSTRYQLEPSKRKKSRQSPRWYGPSMLTLMGIGVALIVWNYTRGVGSTSNGVLVGGLAVIFVGFVGVTFWK